MSRRKYLTPVFALALTMGPIAAHADMTASPSKIISLSPSATEDLFAIGAGPQVIAVDDLSNFPANAPVSKLSAYDPNVEAIAAYSPDLVIMNSTATKEADVATQLQSLGITVYTEVSPNSIAQAYSELTDLGAATGHATQASTVVAKMKSAIASIVKKTRKKNPISFLHEVDNTNYSATSQTFIGHVYSDFNMKNIADGAKQADASGYPQLQSEYIIKANPRLIFLSDAQYGESAKTVAKRPGWSNISAVKNKHVIALPADIPSRWGPRLVDLYQFVATSIAKIS
jgi:iron complex transport system substrate-binding protein